MIARTPSLALVALLVIASAGHAQDWDSNGHGPPPTWHVNLAIHNTGLSIGNSMTFTGLRLNWRDYRLDRIHGLHVTLWGPGDHVGGEITGVATGPFGPGAGRLRRPAAGPLAPIAGDGSGRGMGGFAVSGIATVSGQDMRGINVGGLALVSGQDLRWLNMGGLAVVGEQIDGVSLSAGAVESGSLQGFAVGGYRVKAREAEGFFASALYTRTRYLTGVAVAPYNRVRALQVGLAIGVVNDATELHGVHLGVIKIARNNRGWRRVPPPLNLPP